MTDTVTTQVTITQGIVDQGYHLPIEQIRPIAQAIREAGRMDALSRPFTTWHDQARGDDGRDLRQFRNMAVPLADVPDGELRFLAGFLHWLYLNHRHMVTIGDPMNPTTTTVPSGDKTVIPIGPEHPGWAAFWETVAEQAEEDGYQEQYNVLARAFGAAEIDDDSEVEVEVTISVSLTTSVRMTMRRSEYIRGDYELDQGDIDDAIVDYVRHDNADVEVIETEIVD